MPGAIFFHYHVASLPFYFAATYFHSHLVSLPNFNFLNGTVIVSTLPIVSVQRRQYQRNKIDQHWPLLEALRGDDVVEAEKQLELCIFNHSLDFSGIRLDRAAFAMLVRVVLSSSHSLTTCRRLILEDTGISGEQAAALINALTQANNTTLRALQLQRNALNEADAVEIASAVLCNCTLHVLSLSHNCIGDGGIAAIAGALRQNQNTALKELHLFETRLAEAGVRHLIELVQAPHTCIEEIRVSYIPAMQRLRTTLREATEVSKKVRASCANGIVE